MKIKLFALLLLLYLAAGIPAYADEMFYVGASYGQTTYDTGVTNLTGTAKMDNETASSKILVGVNVGYGLVAEVYYTNMGEVTFTANNGDTFTSDGVVYTNFFDNYKTVTKTDGYGVNAVYKYGLPIGTVFAKLGVLSWSQEAETTIAGTLISQTSDSGTDILYGAGFEFGIAPLTSLRLEYEQVKIDGGDVSSAAIGVIVSF